MKKIILFSRYFLPATILSLVLIVCGIVGMIYFSATGAGAFNLGVDFQAGLIQEVQFAPRAFTLTYSGADSPSISMTSTGIEIVLSGVTSDQQIPPFLYSSYATIDTLIQALREQMSGLQVNLVGSVGNVPPTQLVQSAYGNPELGTTPFMVHYLPAGIAPIPIEEVRQSLSSLGTISVQVLGMPTERRFMIRTQASQIESTAAETRQKVIATLEKTFGAGEVVITSDRFVDSRFSKQLTDQAGILMVFTILLILIYASIRFKPQFAIGAVLAIIHDGLIMITFIVWSRMEFNTTTIAAILTILGYSINDTIVIFDRIRETQRLEPDTQLVSILDRAITETLKRTIITTLTTMLAVFSLLIFTSGSMRDFAAALLVGMLSGVYSTIFIASGFVNFWGIQARKKANAHKKAAVPASLAKVKA
ncbi:MAG: protein translocase subunit SecF [Spirochaetaceae bacterium]|jgi:preprotein translocase subunit SecF|nr:protein translocase subunit SecF [Spirochaetaceae bacterium]